MTESTESSTEGFARFSRASMFTLLVLVILLGGTGLALILSPDGAVARSAARASWLIPVLIAIVVSVQAGIRGRRWAPDSLEVKVVMNDEFRRANMDRAARLALIVILVAEWPLSFLFGFLTQLPTPRAAMGMAAATMTLGLTTLITLFLYFDRE
jgi:hypothetical protein